MHTAVKPLMLPGFESPVPAVTVSWLNADEPQALLAVTEMEPPVAPTTGLMLLVVDEPLQPLGNVQV